MGWYQRRVHGEYREDRTRESNIMIRILTLAAAASAYPQHSYNPYMVAPYPLQYAPLAPQPQVFPAPVVQARSEDEFDLIEDAKEARYLINFEAFQRVSGSFVADAGATVPTTITGVASFYQNPFTGQNSKYKITLNGLTAGQTYWVGLVTTTDVCVTKTGADTDLRTGTAPSIFLFDTVKIYGTLDTHNIDGAGGRTALTGLSLEVRDTSSTGTVIGCTSANLA